MRKCIKYLVMLIGFSCAAQEKSAGLSNPSSKLQVHAAPRQRLDSIINTQTLFYNDQGQQYAVYHIDKTIYVYDSLNSSIGIIFSDNGFEKTEEWQGQKSLTGRDALGRDTVVYHYSFRKKTADWHLQSKTVYSYEKNTRKYSSYTNYVRWEEKDMDEWEEKDRIDFKYDEKDSLIEKISYRWRYNVKEKMPNYKDVFQYDHKNKVLHSALYIWDTKANDWKFNFKKDTYFNQKWDEIGGVQYLWDAKAMAWKKNQKWDYVYNIYNKRIEEKYYYWDFAMSAYSMTSKNSYVYDKAGNATEEIHTNWHQTTKQMTSKYKHECLYDGMNNLIRSNYYDWSLSKNVWEMSSESFTEYDLTTPANLIKTPHNYNSKYKLLSSKGISYRNGVKSSPSEYRYYYSVF